MCPPWKAATHYVFYMLLVGASQIQAQEPDSEKGKQDRIQTALEQVKLLEIRSAENANQLAELTEVPLLTFGDSARSNDNGTVWAFGKVGRPVALVELFRGVDDKWIHCMTLTSLKPVVAKTPRGIQWTPKTIQSQRISLHGEPSPHSSDAVRLRQMKDLARRFTAHEFWDPNNSRFELRLLARPIHRYSDHQNGLQDGAVFILAHGTNPEAVLLIEALGDKPETARWHFSLARLASAEVHVEFDGKDVWQVDRAVGITGRPTDPYWSYARNPQ